MSRKGSVSAAAVTMTAESSVISSLEAKLAAVEKRLAELELKYAPFAEANPGPGPIGVSRSDGHPDLSPIDARALPGGPQFRPPGVLGAPGAPGAPGVTVSNTEVGKPIEKEEPSPHVRIKIIKQTKDRQTGERIERPEETKAVQPEDNSKHAFILRKEEFFDGVSNEMACSEIDIVNPALWELLKEHLSWYPYHIFRGSPVTLNSPFEPLVHEWDALKKAAEQTPKDDTNKQAREDLDLLLKTISGGSSGDAKLDRYFKQRDVTREQKTVQFDNLWTIFPPGTLVYGRPFQNEPQLFLVEDCRTPWPDTDGRQQAAWRLTCWTYDWNGDLFQRTPFTLTFEPYEGHRPITSLPFYPFEYHSDISGITATLVERGKKFRMLCSAKEAPQMFEYNGDSMFVKRGFFGSQIDDDEIDVHSWTSMRLRHSSESALATPAKPSHVKSRVMVDYKSYFQYGPPVAKNGSLDRSFDYIECECNDCMQNEKLANKYKVWFDTKEAQNKREWEAEQYMLCPPRVLGYILRDKQWAQLQVDLIQPIPANTSENPWNSRLMLNDDSTKEMLLNLVQSHISSTQDTGDEPREMGLEVDDIIPGKGKGLVILLYGPPGVGKTSTAETIAVAARKPLFSISVADVGTKAKLVESNLSRIFALATRWQAILLIDEADVFLESRGRGASASTDRNALVSVFLRVLEYYHGIMFLTTNQIAQFDVAIPSRIHVAIRYEGLNKNQMQKIFEGFLRPLEEKNLIDDYAEIKEYLSEDVYSLGFDGRQIRNIVTTALGLARAEKKSGKGKGKLAKKHLRSAVKNTNDFKIDFSVMYDRYINSQEKMIKK